jgi:hypothetical protein
LPEHLPENRSNGKSQNESMAFTGKYDTDLLGNLGLYSENYHTLPISLKEGIGMVFAFIAIVLFTV